MTFLYRHRLFLILSLCIAIISGYFAYFAIIHSKQNVNIIYYIIATFILIELLVFRVIRLISYRLHHVIKQQTIELNLRNQVLEQLVQGKPLNTILESIVLSVEQSDAAEICSILLLDDSRKHLLLGAAPNLPDFYNKAIDGIKIGDDIGSCCTAAFRCERVIVEDIPTHPYWSSFKEIAAKANLGACWSQPIIGSNNQLLGTFALYYHQKRAPTDTDLKLITSVSQLAAVAIERKQSDEKQQISLSVFNSAHEGILITDAQGKIITVNPMFSLVTGYSSEEVVGKNPNILKSDKHSDEFYADIWQSVASKYYWKGEIWNRKKNGQVYAELLSISALLDDEGKPRQYLALFSDITESKQQQQSLEQMAHYDVLTNLPNRVLFADRFERAIAHSRRSESLLAVCFLDLDNFKPINDNYGHQIGDQLLIEVATRLKDVTRDEDTVCRQGGDEFALLLVNFDSFQQCEALLRRIHSSLAQPYIIEGETHFISASSGTTIYPLDDGDIDTLIRHADQAMYQAKLAGKNNFRLFDASDDKKIMQQHAKLQEIKQAIDNHEFCLFYQPKVNMKTGKVFGVEALIRWMHPEKGLTPPSSFLSILNGTDIEITLGNWVINEALRQAEIWQQQGITLEVSVNISSHHLQAPNFITQLNEALLRHPHVDPAHFELEVLESTAIGDLETVTSIVRTCRELLGLSVALDDFGTGYSSLTHLRNLHANIIKIDQSFIHDMLDDPDDFAIIEGVISLSKSFDRTVIAEGVETTEHGLMLLLIGCNHAQGYAIARPLPAADVPIWLQNYQPNQEWISCGKSQLTPKESKIKLLHLTANQWYQKFSLKQISPMDPEINWPLMNPQQCHCGAWLKRVHKEQIFDEKWLHSFALAHENMHSIATKIMHQQQNKITGNAPKHDLDTLHAAMKYMNLLLGSET